MSHLGWFLLCSGLLLIAVVMLGGLAGWIGRWMRAQLDEPDEHERGGV